MTEQNKKVVSDYNGYDYKKIFWEDADRKYEDMADRLAIRRLLPRKMDTFVDIAGGYGRLAKEYLDRAKTATLFDYSQTELDQAKEEFGDRINTVQGDIYHTPFKDNQFSCLLMVRATHHFEDLPAVIKELNRILEPGGVAVIEVANKRTLPKMFRYWFKKSKVNPFDKKPSNLKNIDKDGFYNYHPAYVEDLFRKSGFEIADILSVSNFRSQTMKKVFKTKTLVNLEKKFQKPLASMRFAPSIYYKLVKKSTDNQ
ncbi:MAG: class I SAM-dependent methyltransferase [Candidatus Nanosynbacter sp.]|nr:class I SAM-dependent methyltransferase [Candidatus Nanosynbacter sp.]